MTKILVIGTTGVIGDAVITHCKKNQINVVGISRKPKESTDKNVEYIACDITSGESIEKIIPQLNDVTHIVYAAYAAKPDYGEENSLNTEMFSNVITKIVPKLPKMTRVVLIQGLMAYGAHLGPFKTPAVETDPRPLDTHFYFAQEDLLKNNEAKCPWTVVRPDAVCGTTAGFPMNISLLVAVYASLSKELGLPLSFPGSRGGYETLMQVIDSNLLAEAIVWAATSENCASETINVTNGDYFRWEHLWPKVAKFFEMDIGPRQQIVLADQIPPHGDVWERIIKKYKLDAPSLDKIVAWGFGDFLFNTDYDIISNINRSRQLGFTSFIDTEAMFLDKLRTFQKNKIIP